MTESICRCEDAMTAADLVSLLTKNLIPAAVVDLGEPYIHRYSVRVAPNKAKTARYIRQYIWPTA
jgi:hypothetical protein